MGKWEMVKLGDVCEKKIDKINSKDDFIIDYVDISAINNETKKITQTKTIHSKKAPSRAKQILKSGDILVSTVRPNLNAVAINDLNSENKVIASTGYCVLRKKENIELRYLFNYCRSKSFIYRLSKIAKGASYPAVSNSDVRNSLIPLPPLETQKQIANTLDNVAELLALRKKQLEELDQLIKSVFYDMFGDPVTNEKGWESLFLKDICLISSSKRIFEKDYVKKGVPFYRTKEIVEFSKGNLISKELFISNERYEQIRDKYDVPRKNDILISAVGTIGSIWVVPDNKPFYFKDGNLLWIKSNEKFNSYFLKMVLSDLIKYHTSNLTAGSAYKALTIIKLKEMQSILPPLHLQNDFAENVSKIEKQKAIVKKTIDETQHLFDSLMSQYFD